MDLLALASRLLHKPSRMTAVKQKSWQPVFSFLAKSLVAIQQITDCLSNCGGHSRASERD
jgi:hypothetical protein